VYRPLVSAYHGRTIDAETIQSEQRDYAGELVDFLGGALSHPPESVLDVGGSAGVVAGAVSEAFGAHATVLDPAPDELAVAEAAGMETISGLMEDHDLGGRTWDLVLLCQTIDHLLDVRATLRAIRETLGPDGHVFVDILDLALVLRVSGEIEGAVKIDHPFYVTDSTARAYFHRAALRVVAERISDDNHRGFLLAPAEPCEPDWDAVGRAGRDLLTEILSPRTFTREL
jgi:2-polyprenyl-3-methyl-5-hydroxy-6-metoxy-1,4-benzoquinol methylase